MGTVIYKINRNYPAQAPIPQPKLFPREINFDAKSPGFFVNPAQTDVPIGVDFPGMGITTTGTFYAVQKIPIFYYELEDAQAKHDLNEADPESKGELDFPIDKPNIEDLATAMLEAQSAGITVFARGYVLENLIVIGTNIKEGQEFPYTNKRKGISNVFLTIISCPCELNKFGNQHRYTITATNLPLPTFEEFMREKIRQLDFPDTQVLPRVVA